MKRTTQAGFTMIELVIIAGILSLTIVGMVRLFIFTSVGAQLAGNKTQAISEAEKKLAEIRNYSFDDISTDYESGGTMGNTFNPSHFDGPAKGVVYIDDTNAELLIIDTVVCWEDKYGRIIGEDINLNGTLDTGEDLNSNGKIDSIVELSTMLTRR